LLAKLVTSTYLAIRVTSNEETGSAALSYHT
jgi:hypothetical protein